ncbi:hypothetical protein RHGRI_012507 [Rhododendron griersonianum]|uniref:RNase H type-1 domain-containing protein n=1 Tax=Rhododendron griersonianum TaxID=479676 RepID=A0AAV6KR53_9ERIC|nr:hypothetical protein RHGRI_012507 [Rhododendron griersonianum]
MVRIITSKLEVEDCFNVFSDKEGIWVTGYFGRLQNSSPSEAELWGILKGLTFMIALIVADCTHHGWEDGG